MPSGLIRRTESVWLPSALIALFIAQNFIFNEWLEIYPGKFTFRLILVAFSLGTAVFAPAILMGRKWRYPYLAVMASLSALVFISQYLYYSYSGGYLQASALLYAGEAVAIRGTIKNLLTPGLLIFALGPIGVLGAFYFSLAAEKETIRVSVWAKVWISSVILAVCVSGYSFLFFKEAKEWGSSAHLYQYSKLYDVDMLVAKTGVMNYFLADAANFVLKSRRVTPEDMQMVAKWRDGREPASVKEENFGSAKGRNLILIQVESLEDSLIGKKTGEEEITPNLNKLAKEGLYFDNYFAQVGPGNTADAEFSTLNSLYPLSDEVAFIGYAKNHYSALPELLRQNGYGTYAFHGDVPSFWNRANIYPNLGYDESFSRDDYSIPRAACFADLCDGDFMQQSLEKLKALPEPFMATLITLSSHTPFVLPPDLQTLNVPDDKRFNQLQWGYLESIHYADDAIGKFIEGLKKEGLYDDSLIVIFGDHGSFIDISSALGGESLDADMEKDHVPLIVLAPNSNLKRGTDHSPATHLDLYPTISAALGIQAPKSVLGQDLLATDSPIAVRRNTISGTVQEVLTEKVLYRSSSDGVFDNGFCIKADSREAIPVNECRDPFDRAKNATLVSDIVVRDDLIGPLTDKERTDKNAGLTVL